MINFLNSPLFAGLSTIITGAGAYGVYWLQQKNKKIQAARVLLTEIRIAEDRIEQIRDKISSNSTLDLPSVFPTKSWKTYSHLFISDFDQDELDVVNSFYDYGELVEEFAKRNNDFFWLNVEERGKVTIQKLGEFIAQAFGKSDSGEEIKNKRDFLGNSFDNYNLPYIPQKTLAGVQSYLSKVQRITTTSCGTKLKKLAKLS